MSDEEKNCELKDIILSIKRYVASSKGRVAFVGSFVTFKESEEKCSSDECENHLEEVDQKASEIIAFGDLEDLRWMLNGLRDTIEDSTPRHGHVEI